jgi:hypothetical protein
LPVVERSHPDERKSQDEGDAERNAADGLSKTSELRHGHVSKHGQRRAQGSHPRKGALVLCKLKQHGGTNPTAEVIT